MLIEIIGKMLCSTEHFTAKLIETIGLLNTTYCSVLRPTVVVF